MRCLQACLLHYTASLVFALLLRVNGVESYAINPGQHVRQPLAESTNAIELTSWRSAIRDAYQECGEGCISMQLLDIARFVPHIESLAFCHLYFYDQMDALNTWDEFVNDPFAYEVVSVNPVDGSQHTLATFYPDSKEQYNSGWRSIDLARPIRQWYTQIPLDKEIYMKVLALNGAKKRHVHYTLMPFLLVSIKSAHDYSMEMRLKRSKRGTRGLTVECDSTLGNNQPCCVNTTVVDMTDPKHQHLSAWWITPNSFELKYCSGRCGRGDDNVYRQMLQVQADETCCKTKEYQPFVVDLWMAGKVTRSALPEFMTKSCECT